MDSIETITGTTIPLRGNDIDTDRIIPARFLRCVTFDGLGEHAFEDDRQQNPEHPFNQDRYQNASILFVGRNFGCGSSREHAPQSLQKWGIRGIVGVSFAEIFYGNCIAMGIPCMRVSDDEIQTLFRLSEDDSELACTLAIPSAEVRFGTHRIQADLPEGVRNSFLSGDWNATKVLLQAGDRIEETAAQLPYINGFATA